jgi:ferric iron reductase protein FhuF
MRNAVALGALTDLVSFLRWRIGPAVEGELVCATLAADPAALAGAVAATAPGRGTDDPQVAASLWWQSYSYRVAGTALGSWLVTGAAPEPGASVMAVGVSRSRPSSVVYADGAGTITDLDRLVTALFDEHLDPVAASLRAGHALGSALIDGNTGSSIESALGAVCSAPGAPDLQARLDRVRAALPHRITAAVTITEDGIRRRTCCLWWKSSEAGGRLCADCSLRDRTPGATVPGDD